MTTIRKTCTASLVVICSLAAAGCAQMSGPLALGGFKGDQIDSQVAVARLCEGQDQTEQAKQIYRAILEEKPQHIEANHRLAVLLAREGRNEEVETLFLTACDQTTDDANLFADFGFWLYLQGRLQEAEATLREALSIDSQLKTARANLALTVGELGNYDESFALFREAYGDARAHANLAFVCAQRNDVEKSEAHFHRALELDPNLRPAAAALLELARNPREERSSLGDNVAASPTAPSDAQAAADESGEADAAAVQPAVYFEATDDEAEAAGSAKGAAPDGP